MSKGFSVYPQVTDFNAGFFVVFEHCYISVQFSAGNYCEHYRNWKPNLQTSFDPKHPKSADAEVAIMLKTDRTFVTQEIIDSAEIECRTDGQVIAECTPEKFAKLCLAASQWTPKE